MSTSCSLRESIEKEIGKIVPVANTYHNIPIHDTVGFVYQHADIELQNSVLLTDVLLTTSVMHIALLVIHCSKLSHLLYTMMNLKRSTLWDQKPRFINWEGFI